MGIILNNDQIYASMKIESWWKSSTGDQVFELDGPAGSGKTTLIMSLIEKIGLSLDDVLFVAFCTVMMLILGTVVGSSATKYHYNNRLKSVGIEKIVYCNNVHSNWCVIVWIKK